MSLNRYRVTYTFYIERNYYMPDWVEQVRPDPYTGDPVVLRGGSVFKESVALYDPNNRREAFDRVGGCVMSVMGADSADACNIVRIKIEGIQREWSGWKDTQSRMETLYITDIEPEPEPLPITESGYVDDRPVNKETGEPVEEEPLLGYQDEDYTDLVRAVPMDNMLDAPEPWKAPEPAEKKPLRQFDLEGGDS